MKRIGIVGTGVIGASRAAYYLARGFDVAATDLAEGAEGRLRSLVQEIKGHVANRLQAALWQEALSLVEQGVATVADIDTAISQGPGLRWALLGPFLNLEIAGGVGGLAQVVEHLGPPMESWWADLKPVHLNDDLKQKAVRQVKEYLAPYSFEATVQQRDDILVQLLDLKKAADQIP